MEEMNLKVFLTKTGMYFVGNLVEQQDKNLVFNYLFMLAPQQDKMAMMPFGMNMAKDDVNVNKDEVMMMADAVEALVGDYTRAVGEIKAARAGIVLAPANALGNLPKQGQAKRPDVQKLM